MLVGDRKVMQDTLDGDTSTALVGRDVMFLVEQLLSLRDVQLTNAFGVSVPCHCRPNHDQAVDSIDTVQQRWYSENYASTRRDRSSKPLRTHLITTAVATSDTSLSSISTPRVIMTL